MSYKFRSRATGDLLMLQASGDELLRLLGREPAAQGIIEPAAMPAAITRLQAALQDAEPAEPGPAPGEDDGEIERERRPVGLRQRLWPVLEMLRRAQAADEPITWGV